MADSDRFSDAYDPEPDYDRPTRAEAQAEVPTPQEVRAAKERLAALAEDEYSDNVCPVCGVNLEDDPHAPDCPVPPADGYDDAEGF